MHKSSSDSESISNLSTRKKIYKKRLLKNKGKLSKRRIHKTNYNWNLFRENLKIMLESVSNEKNIMKENIYPNMKSCEA